MKKFLFFILISSFSLTVISCRNSNKNSSTDNETTNNETTNNETTNNELIGNNNNSILSGSRIGSGEDYNSDLSKSVRISVKNSGVFSYQTPYCGRVSTETESFRCVIPIRNLSRYPSCFISMSIVDPINETVC